MLVLLYDNGIPNISYSNLIVGTCQIGYHKKVTKWNLQTMKCYKVTRYSLT